MVPSAGVAHLVERDLAKVEVASSSLVARSKKERHPHGCLSFLEQHFCYAKVVACGRVIEREWGNPSKVPPSHSPFLAMCRGADNKICTQSVRRVFSFLELHFCYAKVVACGRVIERERGNPSKVPPHTPPSLRYQEKLAASTCALAQSTKTPPERAAFLFAAAAAYPCRYRPGENSWFTARGACCSTPDRRCSAGRQRHRAPCLRPRSWGWRCCRRW